MYLFPSVINNKVWLGYGFKGGAAHFVSPYDDIATATDHKEGMIRVSGVHWFTNLDIPKRNEEIDLICKYSPEEYPKYDNYNAINVNKTQDKDNNVQPDDKKEGNGKKSMSTGLIVLIIAAAIIALNVLVFLGMKYSSCFRDCMIKMHSI